MKITNCVDSHCTCSIERNAGGAGGYSKEGESVSQAVSPRQKVHDTYYLVSVCKRKSACMSDVLY